MNREQWINDLADQLASTFQENGYTVPANIRYTVGWCTRGNKPSLKSGTTLGQCLFPENSKDNHHEIVISMSIDDPMRVAGILTHEMIHAIVGLAAGHGKVIKRCATVMGLEGKMTATPHRAPRTQRLQPILDKLGPYPHASYELKGGKKTQSTRMIKAECDQCGYTVRTSQKWIDVAIPTCPVHGSKMVVS